MANQVTIGQLIVELLKAGKSSKETLASVKLVFPDCQTTMKSVYHYACIEKIRLGRVSRVDSGELAKLRASLKVKAA